MASSHIACVAPLLAAAVLGGCAAPAGPLSLSLTELGSETKEDAGTLFGGIRHRRSHNVTGLGSYDMVGALSSDPDPPIIHMPQLFSQRTLPDQIALRMTPGCSKVVVRDVPMPPNTGLPEVLKLRDALQDVQRFELQLMKLQAEAALIDAIIALDASPAPAASTVEDPGKAQRRRSLVDAWHALASDASTPADAAGWSTRQAVVATERGALQAQADHAYDAFARARSTPGLVVARWDYEASRQSAFSAVGVQADVSDSGIRRGFVVLGHPRTLTLVAGNDLVSRACRAHDAQCDGAAPVAAEERRGIDSSLWARRLYTTTFQLLAEHLAWAESGLMEQQRSMGLQLDELIKATSAPELGSVKATLQALKIHLAHSEQWRTSGENIGAVSGAAQWDEPFSFYSDESYERSLRYLRAINGSMFSVSSMRSTLDVHADSSHNRKPRNESACEQAAPTDQQVARVVCTQLGCDRLADATYTRTLSAGVLASRHEACTRSTEGSGLMEALAAAADKR